MYSWNEKKRILFVNFGHLEEALSIGIYSGNAMKIRCRMLLNSNALAYRLTKKAKGSLK